ncbi:unnamed protein product [Boreogadus saida]
MDVTGRIHSPEELTGGQAGVGKRLARARPSFTSSQGGGSLPGWLHECNVTAGQTPGSLARMQGSSE